MNTAVQPSSDHRVAAHPRVRPAAALRLGFIAPRGRVTPDAISGMPHRMRAELAARFAEVVTIGATVAAGAPARGPLAARARALGQPAARTVRRAMKAARTRTADLFPARVYREMLAGAHARSAAIQPEIDATPSDVLFGCCISAALVGLRTRTPIVYFSDATARVINETYPSARRRGRGYKAACDELERTAMHKCAAAIFASEASFRSAINDYGLDPARAHLVEMGAHVTPRAGELIAPPRIESRRVRLCIVAADPARKRVDLAVRATHLLKNKGWNAQLVHVGKPTRLSTRSAAVVSIGRLRLSDEADRRKHAEILASCHLLLLPSEGEAYGIAPCEAAHFGRPSVVSAAGGLPTVVEHGVTGLVLPVEAGAEAYAAAIDGLLNDPARYQRMCDAALRRARDVLNWECWADRVTRIIEDAAANGARHGDDANRSDDHRRAGRKT